jgi:hypothetical protein
VLRQMSLMRSRDSALWSESERMRAEEAMAGARKDASGKRGGVKGQRPQAMAAAAAPRHGRCLAQPLRPPRTMKRPAWRQPTPPVVRIDWELLLRRS